MESRLVHPNFQLTDITDRFIESAKGDLLACLLGISLTTERHPNRPARTRRWLHPVRGSWCPRGASSVPTVSLRADNIEIGDPKMDSGALEDGEDLEDHFDVSQPLSSEQAIWIIDELICREVSWLQGYPLSQTLFTSIYLDKLLWPEPKALHKAHFLRSMDPDHATSLTQDLLRAYCLGMIKCCDLVLSMVTSQHYYEVSHPASSRTCLSHTSRKKISPRRYTTETCFGVYQLMTS